MAKIQLYILQHHSSANWHGQRALWQTCSSSSQNSKAGKCHLSQELEKGLRCLASQAPSLWSRQLVWDEYAHNSLPRVSSGIYGFQCVATALMATAPGLRLDSVFREPPPDTKRWLIAAAPRGHITMYASEFGFLLMASLSALTAVGWHHNLSDLFLWPKLLILLLLSWDSHDNEDQSHIPC